MPKPTKPLTYSPKNDAYSSASETTPASPAGSTVSTAGHKPKCTAKRKRSSKPQSVQEPKKSKLVTLRASHTEDSDDEEKEKQWEVEEGLHHQSGSSRDNIAAAFVPASLRFPEPLIVEVEETMEEVWETVFHRVLHILYVYHLLFLLKQDFYKQSLHYIFLCMVLHSIIHTLHSELPHPMHSLISWSICPMCWASPKMLRALMSLASWHKMRQAQLDAVNISWTY